MAKISLSGFPEWLPSQRLIEQHFLNVLQNTFELHGFSSIETRAVEPLSELTRKGETSKEVYLLSRLQAAPGENEDPRKQLGLHFDLTVPFARYVLEYAGQLTFPFKRYQIQKVWRGERPQEGRFREFIQADIDVVGDGKLPLHYDAELPLIMHEALSALPIPQVLLHVSNRKVAQGFYTTIGVAEESLIEVLRVVDKLDKIGPEAVAQELEENVGLSASQAQLALQLAGITASNGEELEEKLRALLEQAGLEANELLEQGIGELAGVLEVAARRRPGALIADLKIARGLDYYTGTVYESELIGHEDLGSICSGGRYDSLASNGKRSFPGVGLSIGVSRLLARVIGAGLVQVTRPVPTAVLVAVTDEASRPVSEAVADKLRARGICADVAPTAAKFGKQIKFADKRGIPFVWFPAGVDEAGTSGADSVKDIRSGEQVEADAATWQCPEQDLRVQVVPAQA